MTGRTVDTVIAAMETAPRPSNAPSSLASNTRSSLAFDPAFAVAGFRIDGACRGGRPPAFVFQAGEAARAAGVVWTRRRGAESEKYKL